LGYTRQIDDQDIYNCAIKTNRFVVTINFKDFKKLIPSSLSNEDIDLILSNFVSKHNSAECLGQAIKITQGDAAIIKKNC